MGDAVFHNPDKTNIEAYRDGLKLVRESAGPDVFILGCCVPRRTCAPTAAPSASSTPCASAPTTAPTWNRLLRGPTFGTRHYFLHGRIWYNDPDPVYVRADMPLNHAQLICSWVALSGQLNLNSEWLPGLPAGPPRHPQAHHAQPRTRSPAPSTSSTNDPPRIWLLTDPSPAPQRAPRRHRPLQLGRQPPRLRRPARPHSGSTRTTNTPPSISGPTHPSPPQGPPPTHRPRPILPHHRRPPRHLPPQLISTSRHVTQGIVDVLDENWHATTRTLAGTTTIIGNDPYELRILAPSSGWHAQSAAVSAADQAAGVTASFTQSNDLVRVTLNSPLTRQVEWTVTFVIGPAVTLTNPANGAVFYTNDVIQLAAHAAPATAPVTNVSFYRDTTKLGDVAAEPYTLSISNQPPGIWLLTAVATDSDGTSTTSAAVQVEIIGAVPAPPTGLTAAPGNGQVTLTWTATPGATRYNVKRSTVSGGPYTAIANPLTPTFTDTGVTNRRAYYYVVSGLNPLGEGANSAQATATPSDFVAAGLVAHLTFDDGTATDMSGHGNHGTLVNDASIVTDTQRGNVLSLDGADDYVDIGNGTSLDLSDDNQATITAWVKMAASKVHNAILSKGEWREAYSLVIKGDTTPKDKLWTGNDTTVNSADPVPVATWTHVAVTINGALTTFYINGQLSGATNQNRGNPIDNTTTGVSIGREQYSASLPVGRWHFNGQIDDVRIYQAALTQVEVQNVMSNALNSAPAFTSHPLTKPATTAGQPYATSIAANAADPDPDDTITFAKVNGPAWLSVAPNGALSGIPLSADAGTNSFAVRVADPDNYFDETLLNIVVNPAPPIHSTLSRQGTGLWLAWTGGIAPFQVQTKTNLLDSAWQNLGGSVDSNSLPVTPAKPVEFFRVQGQ